MKRAVLFLHGDRPSKHIIEAYVKMSDTIICADGGTKHALSFGILPHAIIGDNDSLPKTLIARLKKKKNIVWKSYPTEKDETDSELAITYALEQGVEELIIVGWFGDRLDHMLANLMFFTTPPKKVRVTIIHKKQMLFIVHAGLTLQGKEGEYVSLIPLKGDVQGITTIGLKFPLTNARLSFGEPRGVSNEFVKEKATITIKGGVLLVIHTKR